MSTQVIRPMIPYRGGIPGGLREGKIIQIRGTIPFGADGFEVNLQTGYDTFSDRALHLNVRLDARVAIRNHMERNVWAMEDRSGPFPFARGRVFTMMILAEPGNYKIAVDGQHCWEFRHRIPLFRVSCIHISGMVELEQIEFVDQASNYRPTSYPPSQPIVNPSFYPDLPSQHVINPSVYPNPPTFIPSIPTIPSVCPMPNPYPVPSQVIQPPTIPICPQPPYVHPNPDPVYNPKMPIAYAIPGGLRVGMMIHITGRPFLHPQRFNINLQTGTQTYPAPDVAFHMDVRFDNHSVIRNSRINNSWEREEKKKFYSASFPFQSAVTFNMTLTVTSNKYLVALDGRELCEFHHRLTPISRFTTLYIERDIIVDSIWVS